MKKNFIVLFTLLALTHSLVAQEDAPDTGTDTTKIWSLGGKGSVTFNQSSFTNWVAGGQNSLALSGFLGFFANYKKDRIIWESSMELGYGFLDQKGQGFRKTDDKIRLSSNFGYQLSQANQKLYWSSRFEFLTQFADGFDPDFDSLLISSFMAPGYIGVTSGLEFRPVEYFSINYSPAAGKFTFVTDQTLADQGSFGVEPAVRDTSGNVITEGKNSRAEFGTALKLTFNKEIVKNVTYESGLGLFTNYLEKFGNIDVNWENLIIMKVNDYLSANLIVHVIYDDDIKVPIRDDNNQVIGEGARTQVKQIFGIGLSYSISN